MHCEDIFFVPALLLFTLTPLFSTSVYFFILFHSSVPMCECLEKHSFMSSPFPIAILNGTTFFMRQNSTCFAEALHIKI